MVRVMPGQDEGQGAGLSPDLLLRAYRNGLFPMADTRDSPELFWCDPHRRGVLLPGDFHISRSLARRIRAEPFAITTDRAFAEVVEGCADRPETWINDRIFALFCEMHRLGHAHSLELWEGAELVGGVYGLAQGGVFFAESMFSRRRDASKIALAYLCHRLRAGGFALIDTQFLTPHLASLGAVEMSRTHYRALLREGLGLHADFDALPRMPSPQEVVQRNTQMS